MSQFRYNTSGFWYKGNTHVYSCCSCGKKSFLELAQAYTFADYDFLYRTDEFVLSDVEGDEENYPLLWLDGVEISGEDSQGAKYHIVCLGEIDEVRRDMDFVGAIETVKMKGGLLILAHPFCTGNTFDEALRWGLDGVEVYNHTCHWINGKGDGIAHWNAMLERFPNTLAFSADCASFQINEFCWNGGWVMANAHHLSKETIQNAITSGNFYSTTGPQFKIIEYREPRVYLKTSPVQFIRLVGPEAKGECFGNFEGNPITQADFKIRPEEWPYAYIELEDRRGRRAWTNPLFVSA